MTAEEREQLIDWLIVWTGWAREAFEKMSDEELLEMDKKYSYSNAKP